MDDILLLVPWFSNKRETKRDADNIVSFQLFVSFWKII